MWSSMPTSGIVEIDLSLANLNGLMHLYLHGLVPEAMLESIPLSYKEHIDLEEQAIKTHGLRYSSAHQQSHEIIQACLQRKKNEWLTGQVTANDFVSYASSILVRHVSEYDVNLNK